MAKAHAAAKARSGVHATRTMIQRSRDVSPTAKAEFHCLTGAGRSRVIRNFFDLSATDEEAIVDRIERALDEQVKG